MAFGNHKKLIYLKFRIYFLFSASLFYQKLWYVKKNNRKIGLIYFWSIAYANMSS